MVGVTATGVEVVDDELVDRIRRGDAEAFRALVDTNRDWLVARCRRHLGGDAHAAEDVAQECFVALQRTLARTDRPMAVRPWLSVVARNRCIDETRKKRAMPTPVIPDSAVYDAEVGTEDPHLARAWAALTSRHRAVLELRELGGMSYDEIAVALAVTSGAVETLLFRARTALRREYARAGGKVAAMGPIEEAVQRATGGQGMLTRLAEQAGARFGDAGASWTGASSTGGQALADAAATHGAGSAMASGASPSWLLDLQARLAASGLLDPIVQTGGGGGRLRIVLAGVGALLATIAVTAPTVDGGSSGSPTKASPPAAAVTVPAAPEAPASAPSTDTAPAAPTAPAADAPNPPPAPAADPPAAPTPAPPSPIATTATTVIDAASPVIEGVIEPVVGTVEETVNTVLDLPR